MADAVIATSVTQEAGTSSGKRCEAGRLISEAEGWKLVNAAATWEGTPYRAVGGASQKQVAGDCSGTTNKIYVEAGFSYPYKTTAGFADYVMLTHQFQEIPAETAAMQAGDVLLWSGHMAIYAPFPEGHPKRYTGVVRRGKEVPNDFYTAFNERTGTPYGPYNITTFRGDQYRVFRYFLLPGQAPCEA